MSDIATNGAPPASTEPAPPSSPPEGTPAPSGGDTPPAPPWEGKTPEELGKRIGELTKENADYKQRWRPWEQEFGQLHEQDQQFFFGFIQALRSQDKQAIAQYAGPIRELLDNMSPADQAKAVDALEQAAGGEGQTLTAEQVQKMLDERLTAAEQQRAQQDATQRSLQQIEGHAKALAEKHKVADLGDPRTVLGRMLLLSAHNDFPDEQTLEGRLDRAAEKILEDLNLRGQELLKAKSAGAGPSPVPAGAAEPSGEKKPATMRDAKAAASERLGRILGQTVGN